MNDREMEEPARDRLLEVGYWVSFTVMLAGALLAGAVHVVAGGVLAVAGLIGAYTCANRL